MGILPLRFPDGIGPATLALVPGDRIEIDAQPDAVVPRGKVAVKIHRVNGATLVLDAIAAVETQLEVELLRDGGVIPLILRKTIAQHRQGAAGVPLAA
jgi:aconitate hydratase